MRNEQPEEIHDPLEDDEATYADLVEHESGGSNEGQESGVGRWIDEGDAESPPERPLGSFDPAVTAEGQRRGETLDERLWQEVEEGSDTGPVGGVGELVDAGGDQRPDDEPEAIADVVPSSGPSASEEAAMREVDEDADLGLTYDADDGYVDTA